MPANHQRGRETRAHILQVAQECFGRNGFEATGVAEICECAGVSKGAFYHHFASKQVLFLELLEQWLAELDRGFATVLSESTDSVQGLLRMATLAGRVSSGMQRQVPILFEFWTQAVRDPAIWKAAVAPYRRYHTYVQGLIDKGIAQGTFRATDSDTAARAVLALALGLILQQLIDPEGPAWERAPLESVTLLLSGLATSPPVQTKER